MIALYRNGQAGCFWRKTLTELNESGGKKRTNIYVGSGIVAEQLVHQADDMHSTAWEEVRFKHEDIVTGSYQKTAPDGTLAGGMDPPARVEFEPLGGAIPDGDPFIADYGLQPNPLSSFKYFGDVGRSEFGCLVDGHPSDLCFQLLQSGIAVPSRTFEQPIKLGYWVDEDGPPVHPDDPDTIPGSSVQTRFVPFLLGDGFYLVGFSGSEFQQLNDTIKSMAGNEACSKAFQAAGLTSVRDMMKSNLVGVRDSVLQSPSRNSEWIGNETLRTGMSDGFRNNLTTNDVTPAGAQNGNYYFSLNTRAFSGQDGSLAEIVVHALAHAGGAAPSNSLIPYQLHTPRSRVGMLTTPESYQTAYRNPTHDLEGLNYSNGTYTGKYDNIIKACS